MLQLYLLNLSGLFMVLSEELGVFAGDHLATVYGIVICSC